MCCVFTQETIRFAASFLLQQRLKKEQEKTAALAGSEKTKDHVLDVIVDARMKRRPRTICNERADNPQRSSFSSQYGTALVITRSLVATRVLLNCSNVALTDVVSEYTAENGRRQDDAQQKSALFSCTDVQCSEDCAEALDLKKENRQHLSLFFLPTVHDAATPLEHHKNDSQQYSSLDASREVACEKETDTLENAAMDYFQNACVPESSDQRNTPSKDISLLSSNTFGENETQQKEVCFFDRLFKRLLCARMLSI